MFFFNFKLKETFISTSLLDFPVLVQCFTEDSYMISIAGQHENPENGTYFSKIEDWSKIPYNIGGSNDL